MSNSTSKPSKKDTGGIRVSYRSGYTSIPRQMLSDTRLSIGARGLMALLISMDNGWIFRASHLAKIARCSKDKYYRLVDELKTLGYLAIQREHSRETGRFCGVVWHLNSEPGHHSPENPDSGKSGHIRIRDYKGAPSQASEKKSYPRFDWGDPTGPEVIDPKKSN